MCIHEAVFFIKNNSNLSSPCNALTTDKIQTDTIVSFNSSEVGKTVKVGAIVLYPDGIEHQFWSVATTISSAGIYDFIIPVDVAKFGAGTYSINGAETWNYNTVVLMCSGKPSGGFCQSLTVTTGGNGGGTIGVIAPAGGVSWQIETAHLIQWTASGAAAGGSVRIDLLKGGSWLGIITSNTGNTGGYTWGVGSSLAAGTNYQVKISKIGTSYVGIGSNFTITAPTPPQYHNICSNYVCTQVSGAGTNECSTIGAACGTQQYHNICQNNVCTRVSGIGANECDTPGVKCTHKVCWNNVCTATDGPGTDECTTIGASCGGGGGGVLASITIPSTISVAVGATKAISTACKNTSGNTMICPTLTWGFGTAGYVTISSNGVITGVSVGTTLVNAWDTITGIASNMCTVTVTGGNGGCTNPKYKCGGTDNKYCISDNCDGTGTLPNCLNNPCGTGGVQCLPTQMNIFGTCYKTRDVAMAGAAIGLLLILTRK